ncbi:TAT-variant-translocated molybdopterin oxidoreductase [Anaeromyxobacter sp. SG26]|uniref:TAT-variant-translocated molybdopterin oxidoreductase n=1 Tax=Anaeromyxobacter sp. SG26 TaxID=2925407 RepID=UPI001F56DB42|nr:TAT-variant-translocated molybdopterin oxidoreductase [Anaeromyxobacter sp. SG26]
MPSLGLPIYGQKTALETRRWKSIDELAGRADAEPGEFPEGAAETPAGFSRRGFLQILGASAAFAGLACKPPREKLVPYVRKPEAVTPSVPVGYATARSDEGYAVGLVVQAFEGRPVKVEGNRLHPASLGGTDAITQAMVLDLYDPARLAGFTRGGRALAWSAVLQEIAALAREHDKDGGARLRFLVAPTSSPTVADLRRRLLERFPKARFDTWAPAGGDAAQRAGAAIALGRPLDATFEVAKADVILSLDSDFLATEGEHLRSAREFASRREGERMNRLYVAEPRFSVTGGMADHRFRMRGAEVAAFARAVAAELAQAGVAGLAPLGARAEGEHARAARAVAKDLAGARGRSLIVAGARQPPAVHALAAAMNEALGNVGPVVRWRAPVLVDPQAGPDALRALAAEVQAGKVDTLVVTAWNPLHTAPADLELRKVFGKVKNSMVLALRDDETVRAASWRLAASHPLESWGDLRSRDGTVTVVQPLISPLHESTTEVDLFAAFLGEGERGAWRLVRDGWRSRSGAPPAPLPLSGPAAASNPADTNRPRPPDPFDRTWDEWLAAGLLTESAGRPEDAKVDPARVADALGKLPAPAGGIELGFAPDYKVWDGRFLENAWLQELPDPITKLTWENAAHLSPATARRLGLESGELDELARGGRAVVAPVLVVPGHADDAVTVALGYGQRVAGAVGQGAGFDAYALRTSDAPWYAGGATLKKTGKTTELAITQGHFSMEGRAIALALDHEELPRAKAELDEHRGEAPTILQPVDYSEKDYRWGMAIDLSKCIGCSACTAACQAENNIPVVGKEQVLRSREMHWIRVDRYFEGPPEDPQSVTQPLACVHCEMAPCEYVCPVNATVHSDEGLNEMVYNRCVGTRYCSNNCPYKVRRFNFLDYHGDMAPTLQMLMNPDVTVRARGVMEKCTYCTQRIQRARIDARVGGRKIGPDEVVPACAQACPSEAIVFGNLNDARSRVSRKHADARRYDLLHELGTRPRTAYLVKLRNPNPELA